MSDPLVTERRTYERMRSELIRTDHGKYVLLRGAEVCGIFATEEEGLSTAYRRFGPRAPFYLCRIETVQEEVPGHLGIFSAAP